MSTLETLQQIVARTARCNEQDVMPQTSLADLRIDSLDWVQIIAALESAYDIEIDIELLNDFGTIADLVDYIDRHIA